MNVSSNLTTASLRPGLHPIPATTPLTPLAAVSPPLLYYIALLFLPPAPPPAVNSHLVIVLRNGLALLAAILFLRLPLVYHVPQSIGLTYQLGLVGLYGAARVVDAFFISPYMFAHVPRRVRYNHESRVSTPIFEDWRDINKMKEPMTASFATNASVHGSNGSSVVQRQGGIATPTTPHQAGREEMKAARTFVSSKALPENQSSNMLSQTTAGHIISATAPVGRWNWSSRCAAWASRGQRPMCDTRARLGCSP